MDNSIQKDFFIEHITFAELLNNELHQIQFAELCAKILSKVTLLKRTPYYIIKMPIDLNDKMQIIS